jgi:hypothetical protein
MYLGLNRVPQHPGLKAVGLRELVKGVRQELVGDLRKAPRLPRRHTGVSFPRLLYLDMVTPIPTGLAPNKVQVVLSLWPCTGRCAVLVEMVKQVIQDDNSLVVEPGDRNTPARHGFSCASPSY